MNGKRDNALFDPAALRNNMRKLDTYCYQQKNLQVPLMKAVEDLFGEEVVWSAPIPAASLKGEVSSAPATRHHTLPRTGHQRRERPRARPHGAAADADHRRRLDRVTGAARAAASIIALHHHDTAFVCSGSIASLPPNDMAALIRKRSSRLVDPLARRGRSKNGVDLDVSRICGGHLR